MDLLKRFFKEEEGMGTVEMVMIIAALMCVALLFRKSIVKFVEKIMEIVFDESIVSKPSAEGTK